MSIFTCCTREDESKYIHTCGCPTVAVVTASKSKSPRLVGHSEFESDEDGVEKSDPPRFYKKRAYRFTETWEEGRKFVLCRSAAELTDHAPYYDEEGQCNNLEQEVTCCSCTEPRDYCKFQTRTQTGSIESYVNNRSYSSVYNYDLVYYPELGDFPNTENFQSEQTYGDTEDPPDCPGGSSSLPSTTEVNYTGEARFITKSTMSKKYNWVRNSVTSANGSRRLQTEGWITYGSNPCISEQFFSHPGTSTTFTSTGSDDLSEEDSELEALDREEWEEGSSNTSINETRVDRSWDVTTVDYCFLFRNLVPGKSYVGEVPFSKRVAVEGESAEWEEDTSASISFTATKRFHIEGGSLNPAISDDEFVAMGFQTSSPEDYGLDADEDIIIPSTVLDNTRGWAFRVGQNESGQNTSFCELA